MFGAAGIILNLFFQSCISDCIWLLAVEDLIAHATTVLLELFSGVFFNLF